MGTGTKAPARGTEDQTRARENAKGRGGEDETRAGAIATGKGKNQVAPRQCGIQRFSDRRDN